MTVSLPLPRYIPLQDNYYYTDYGKLMPAWRASLLFLNFMCIIIFHYVLSGVMRLQEKNKKKQEKQTP